MPFFLRQSETLKENCEGNNILPFKSRCLPTHHLKSSQIPPASDLCPMAMSSKSQLSLYPGGYKIIDLAAIRICHQKENQGRGCIYVGCLCCVYSH